MNIANWSSQQQLYLGGNPFFYSQWFVSWNIPSYFGMMRQSWLHLAVRVIQLWYKHVQANLRKKCDINFIVALFPTHEGRHTLLLKICWWWCFGNCLVGHRRPNLEWGNCLPYYNSNYKDKYCGNYKRKIISNQINYFNN